MSLARATLLALENEARHFATKNHIGYLAQALQSTLDAEDPVVALRLLCAMFGSSFASRNEQRAALNDVGRWLEDRLYRDSAAPFGVVAEELGWLRRMARSELTTTEQPTSDAPGGRRQSPDMNFGLRLQGIARRRADAFAALRKVGREPPPPAAPPPLPPPTALPPTFQVKLKDFKESQEARQVARKREKSGKPPKERWLTLQPVDPQLLPLAKGLVCSVHGTEGLDLLFEPGQDAVHAIAFEQRDELRVVTALSKQPHPQLAGSKEHP